MWVSGASLPVEVPSAIQGSEGSLWYKRNEYNKFLRAFVSTVWKSYGCFHGTRDAAEESHWHLLRATDTNAIKVG
jgi:hypothetical protein